MENSQLAKLPGELRNAIYELVLTEPEAIELQLAEPVLSHLYIDDENARLKRVDNHLRTLALTQTCRQLRHESQIFFFKHNTFRIKGRWASNEKYIFIAQLRACDRWLKAIGSENAACIKRLELRGEHVQLEYILGDTATKRVTVHNNAKFPESISTLSNVVIRVTGEFINGAGGAVSNTCKLTGEAGLGLFAPIEILVPAFDKVSAGDQVTGVLADRQSIISEHEAHACLTAMGFLCVRLTLQTASLRLMQAVNDL